MNFTACSVVSLFYPHVYELSVEVKVETEVSAYDVLCVQQQTYIHIRILYANMKIEHRSTSLVFEGIYWLVKQV